MSGLIEPNSVRKTETNIPHKQVYPPDGLLLLYKKFNNILYIFVYMATCDIV